MGAPHNGERARPAPARPAPDSAEQPRPPSIRRCVPGTCVPRRPGTTQTVEPDGTVITKWLKATGEPGDSLSMRPDQSSTLFRPRTPRRP